MIIGTGIDLCRVSRIDEMIKSHGETFLKRILDNVELESLKALPKEKRTSSCAKSWAAKEACVKALGTGFGEYAQFQDIRLFRNQMGAPKIQLSGKALKRAESMVPSSMIPDFLVTLADEDPHVVVSVIFQAIPKL